MKRFVALALFLALILLVSFLMSAVKAKCCEAHFTVCNAFVEDLHKLVERVKTQSLEEFERHYERRGALTHLKLVDGVLEEIAAHYQELANPEDESVVKAMRAQIKKWEDEIKKAPSEAEAKKIIEKIVVKF